MDLVSLLRRRLNMLGFVQVVRSGELAARRGKGAGGAEVGGDQRRSDEPLQLSASDRMTLVSGEVAEIGDAGTGRIAVTANIMGLAGATPALPAFYSEIQLQRRRLRDRSLARFLNIFDHRALSFFYRAFRKYNWLVAFERETPAGTDAISRTMLALAGFATPASRDRLAFDDIALVPLAHHLGDMRRTAASLQLVLRRITGLDVRIVEAVPTWMPLPADAQSRLAAGQFARLGGNDPATGLGYSDAAIIGTAIIDIQHHFIVEIGPLRHVELLRFCAPDGPTRIVGETCLLFAGMAYRPGLRLSIAASDIPPLQLGVMAAPAYLGRTSWLGNSGAEVRFDCVIPVAPALDSATSLAL